LEIIGRLAINLTTRHAIHELLAHVRADQLHIEPGAEHETSSRTQRSALRSPARSGSCSRRRADARSSQQISIEAVYLVEHPEFTYTVLK
jgi:hypothetical protein